MWTYRKFVVGGAVITTFLATVEVSMKKKESTDFLWETELTTSPPEKTGILRKIPTELSAVSDSDHSIE